MLSECEIDSSLISATLATQSSVGHGPENRKEWESFSSVQASIICNTFVGDLITLFKSDKRKSYFDVAGVDVFDILASDFAMIVFYAG